MTSNRIYHYVYRITNLVENKHYYGKRSSEIEPKLDIGKKYFSSSTNKEFKTDQKNNPQNYKYKIVQTFKSSFDAITREIMLHNLFDVGRNEKFYNKAKQTINGVDNTGIKLSKEHAAALKRSVVGCKRPFKNLTKIHKEHISEGLLNKAPKQYPCPHCNKTGNKTYMFKWHFDKCIYSELNDSVIQL